VTEAPTSPLNARQELSFTKTELELLRPRLAGRKSRQDTQVLVVEDQDFSRKLLTSLLQKGVTCSTAATAAEAIRVYAELAPDVVFLDIELPDATGHQLAKLFRKYDPEVILIMVTANSYVGDVEKAKANQVQGFIAKPYTKKKVIDVINSCLRAKGKPGIEE
jgi:CheY-like chemotaxis protein